MSDEPSAWAVMQPDSYSVFASRMLAEKMQELCAGGEIVPLYSHPQPTLTDEEREFLQALRDAYQEMANQTGSVNAAVQADSRKNAAIIRGLLERTK
jgi:hypothetical protein